MPERATVATEMLPERNLVQDHFTIYSFKPQKDC